MSTTLTAVLLAIQDDGAEGEIVCHPGPVDLRRAQSRHALALTSQRELLLVESEGTFTMEQWERVYARAEEYCCGVVSEDREMRDGGDGDGQGSMLEHVQATVHEKIAVDVAWRQDVN